MGRTGEGRYMEHEAPEDNICVHGAIPSRKPIDERLVRKTQTAKGEFFLSQRREIDDREIYLKRP